jgi:hypothetical protein
MNGANLAYTKSLFTALNGFDGNDGIASDDAVVYCKGNVAPVHDKAEYNCTLQNQ